MGFSTQIENDIVFNTVSDGATLYDFLDYVSEHIHEWQDRQVLWDMSKLDFDSLTGDTVREVIHRGSEPASVRAGLKTAYVVDNDVGYGMLRMFQFMAEDELPIEFSVFRDYPSAVEWLNS